MKMRYLKYINGNIAKYLLLIVISLAVTSCQKFLDKGPLDQLSQDNFWLYSSNLNLYISGEYSWLPDINNYFSDNISDNMIGGGYVGGYSSYMDGLTITPTTAGTGGWAWNQVYSSNFFLDNYQKCKDPFSSYQQTLGEAYFLKAYAYDNLVKQFGDVPWYSHVISPADQLMLTKKRDSRAMVVDSIMTLINKSIDLLGTMSTVGNTRINQETALIYKSRVALYEASWSKYHAGTPSASTVDANKYFQMVIDAYSQLKTLSGDFGGMIYSTGKPNIDYFNLFNQADYSTIPEVTLSRTYSTTITGAAASSINFWTENGYYDRGYTLSLVQSFLDKNGKTIDVTDPTLFPRKGATCLTDLKATLDPRFGQSVFVPGDVFNYVDNPSLVYTVCTNLGGNFYNATASGYWPKKGNNPYASGNAVSAGVTTVSAICFRVPEIMFNYVEAFVELNNALPDLSDNIDRIRARVGMPPLTGNLPEVDATWVNYGYPVSNNLAIVRNERNSELFGEGYRFDDWRRWRAHALFNSNATRPRGFKYDPADYSASDNATYSVQLDSKGYYDPWKTTLPNGFNFRPDQDYLMPIPLEDITRSKNNLTQNPGWAIP